MSFDDVTDQFITYESRLASFQRNSKKRGSTASGRGTKALNWPHKSITPASLARAGLFFNPTPENPDNATCFLCHKGLDGWEANDDPLLEHLKHAPECGWAVVAAIEAEIGDYAQQDPDQPYMKEARKATFAGMWPHDSKKGWKCKTKQLVDAGWKYTPTEDSDDMATCTYCQLALDGWEPGDKPLEEHYNRSPGCPFFILLEKTQSTKKFSRSKAGRASKASRLSAQSVTTIASEVTSINESTAAIEDSVLASTSTATGGKKTKARKATTKARKTKAKKEEPVEDVEASIEEQAPPAKPARGKKRDSAAVQDASSMAMSPPAKKRGTRKHGSATVNESTLQHDESADITEVVASKKGGKKKTTRKASATSSRTVSSGSATSEVVTTGYEATPGTFPDDDEIERQLEADLERQLTEDEGITADSDSQRHQSKKEKKAKKASAKAEQHEYSRDYAMLNPEPVEPNEDDVDDELRALQAEMEVDGEPAPEHKSQPVLEAEPEPELQELHIPKKGRKAGTRKVSKQSKSKKAKTAPEPVEESNIETEQAKPEAPEIPEEETQVNETTHEDSLISTDTVVKKANDSRLSTGSRGRGRPSKASLASQASANDLELVEAPLEAIPEPTKEQPAKRPRGRPSKASLASRPSVGPDESQASEAAPKRGRGRPSKKSLEARKAMEAAASQEFTQPFTQPVEERMREDVEVYASEEPKDERLPSRVVSFESAQASPAARPMPSSPPASAAHLANPPSTPGRIISPAPSARQAAISPSQSPQSSDAENQPPSSRLTTSSNPKRVALAPVHSTPTRSSPFRRNVIAGLRSTAPWTELDLEAVFGSPRVNTDKENGVERYLKQGQTLTSPEKQMTVQEWIYYNASEAEKKLKYECESIVNRFESEGSKAMRVLEGLVVE
ncbi:bir1 [Fusarium beomiforme]|uniref:Bir1 n=1 Tax=Fusarium beomiforme TaxID=44412 RepID=A0A9P5AC17_9HYPO|nr:bir1 [Fusarium beomiforme]